MQLEKYPFVQATKDMVGLFEDITPYIKEFCTQMNELALSITKMTEIARKENTQRLLGEIP